VQRGIIWTAAVSGSGNIEKGSQQMNTFATLQRSVRVQYQTLLMVYFLMSTHHKLILPCKKDTSPSKILKISDFSCPSSSSVLYHLEINDKATNSAIFHPVIIMVSLCQPKLSCEHLWYNLHTSKKIETLSSEIMHSKLPVIKPIDNVGHHKTGFTVAHS
jgi:hypothetical protein